MLQATERKYIEAVSDPKTGKLFGVVPYAVQRRITEWLNNKFFLFDNNNSSTISTAEKILKIFTLCAKRNNTKLFLVDNLLTVLSDVPGDKENKAQSTFVADLKKFAVKYKVAVILVAHPRKTKAGEAFSNDDVAGSGNITNLADNVISVQKPNIQITKNREFGVCDFIQCSYDPANRRIFQTDIGDRIVYGWDHEGLETAKDPVDGHPEFNITNGDASNGAPF